MAAIDETRRLRCVNYYLIISSHHIYFYIYIYIYIYFIFIVPSWIDNRLLR